MEHPGLSAVTDPLEVSLHGLELVTENLEPMRVLLHGELPHQVVLAFTELTL
jgi:hypothetical protein